MLRSILHQILQEAPELCQSIPASCFPEEIKSAPFDWNLAILRQAFSSILRMRHPGLRICLFIDALDEFDSHLELISEFMTSLICHDADRSICCKICFSSRPREIIRDNFGQYPHFKIQDHTRRDIRVYTEGRLSESSDIVKAMRSSREARDEAGRVAEKIIDKADGVFLWVSLALDDMIKAHSQHESPSIVDLESLLHHIPPELDDFYGLIIERVPNDFRWEAYLALDVILRADEEIGPRDLFGIIRCWPYETLRECYKQRSIVFAESERESISKFLRILKDSCGGIIEIDEDEKGVHLMHETVRAFLSRPTFKQLILGKMALFRTQNGYTELAKFFLTLIQYFNHVDVPGFHIKNRRHPYKELSDKCAKYCFLAEKTSATCQDRMIDGFQPVNPRVFEEYDHAPWFLTPRSSAMRFVVFCNLLLYVQQKLETTSDISFSRSQIPFHLFSGLCHVAAWTNIPGDQWSFTLMAQLFSDNNIHLRDLPVGVSPLEVFFEPLSKTTDSWFIYSDSTLFILQGLIDRGQDPNIGLFKNVGHYLNKKGLLRPLHCANGIMTKLLLENHAEVNARGPRGMTPLDFVIQRVANRGSINDDATLEDIRLTLELLIQYQGMISVQGLKDLPQCISILAAEGLSIEGMQSLPQRSKKMGHLSSKDFIIAPVLRVSTRVSRYI